MFTLIWTSFFAGTTNSTITLTVISIATECEYDFVHVYAGSDESSPKLAALTGAVLASMHRCDVFGRFHVVFTCVGVFALG